MSRCGSLCRATKLLGGASRIKFGAEATPPARLGTPSRFDNLDSCIRKEHVDMYVDIVICIKQ